MLLKNKAAISALIAAAVTTTAAQPDDENIFYYDEDSTEGSNWFWAYALDDTGSAQLRWPNGDECLGTETATGIIVS